MSIVKGWGRVKLASHRAYRVGGAVDMDLRGISRGWRDMVSGTEMNFPFTRERERYRTVQLESATMKTERQKIERV
jgi:hypothetical protein